jgi:hypothetical protein
MPGYSTCRRGEAAKSGETPDAGDPVMAPRLDEHDREQYQTVLDRLTTDYPWLLSDTTSVSEAVLRATGLNSGVGELHLSHALTDASLYARLPDLHGDNLIRLTMYHPFDRNAPSVEDGFFGSLAQAHGTIAAIYGNDYVEPVADPTVVLHGVVPHEYTERNLSSMMTAISAVALRVQRLHDEIERPVREVLTSSDHSPDESSFELDCVA